MAVRWKSKDAKRQSRSQDSMSVFAGAARDRKIRELKARASKQARYELLERKVVFLPVPSVEDEQAYTEFERRLEAFKTAVQLGGRKFDFIEEPSSAQFPRGRWVFTVVKGMAA